MASAERQLRQDLAAAYRLVALYGMDDSIYTHISARVPGTTDQFLINPFGMVGSARTVLRQAWWMAVFPGVAILLTVLALNLVGEGLNDGLNARADGRGK